MSKFTVLKVMYVLTSYSILRLFSDSLGGREGVLVVWQLDTGKKKFLPRIGSPLLYFMWSPDPTLSSVSWSLLFQSNLTHNCRKQKGMFCWF